VCGLPSSDSAWTHQRLVLPVLLVSGRVAVGRGGNHVGLARRIPHEGHIIQGHGQLHSRQHATMISRASRLNATQPEGTSDRPTRHPTTFPYDLYIYTIYDYISICIYPPDQQKR
jgi:hypothetical protein